MRICNIDETCDTVIKCEITWGGVYFNATTQNLLKRYILGKESMEKTIGEEINSHKEKLSEIRALEYVNVITVCSAALFFVPQN